MTRAKRWQERLRRLQQRLAPVVRTVATEAKARTERAVPQLTRILTAVVDQVKAQLETELEPIPRDVEGLAASDVAEQCVEWLEQGEYAQLRALFTLEMRKAITERRIADVWVGLSSQVGAFDSVVRLAQHEREGHQVVLATCQFALDRVNLRFVFDADHRLAGWHVRPARPSGDAAQDAIDGHPAPARPQTPKPPLPYAQRDVQYEQPTDGSIIGGTLTLPVGAGPHPAALLISGSGNQDRDGTVARHKPLLVLADHLTRHGVVVLRVDDRGVGATTGEPATATIQTRADDVAAGVAFLKEQPEVDRNKIGLIGHSEGGMIAPMVAARSADVAFVISLAGSGLPGAELMPLQVEALLVAENELPRDAIVEVVAIQRRIMELVRNDADQRTVHEAVRSGLHEALAHRPQTKPQGVTKQQLAAKAATETRAVTSPWYRSFVKLDPREYWREVRCPVLVLCGERDTQVPAEPNLAAIRQALDAGGHDDARLETRPELNHLFQRCETGSPAEYAKIEQTFEPETLDLVTRWLRDRRFASD